MILINLKKMNTKMFQIGKFLMKKKTKVPCYLIRKDINRQYNIIYWYLNIYTKAQMSFASLMDMEVLTSEEIYKMIEDIQLKCFYNLG